VRDVSVLVNGIVKIIEANTYNTGIIAKCHDTISQIIGGIGTRRPFVELP
jgi:hypothetical protein